jgi:UPF0755 protein
MADSLVKTFVRLIFIFLLPATAAFGSYVLMKQLFLEPLDPSAKTITLIEVASGQGMKEVSKVLEEKGLIRHWWSLDIVARLKGSDKKIHAGEYEMTAAMSPNDMIKKMVSGEVVKRKVTVKEGATIWEIGPLLEQAGIIDQVEFNKAVVDEDLLKRAGINARSFEGYLFPDTYLFSRPITAQRILWTMLEQGEDKWLPEYTQRADELQRSRHEILTLASIIEKESGNFDEQPIISSVFYNRLKEGMRLQSDPTVIYGIAGFDGNLTRAHLETPGPYNTYVNFGLPPGPICNPGESAIRAALQPEQSDYLYFVGDNQGRHIFSTNLKDHNDAVNKYQRGK